jgi:4-hydroxy-tetrahydrodipicolinate reductase
MRIALLGYGKMGRMVEQAASQHDSTVACVIDPVTGSRGELRDAEVAIDFTEPAVVLDNIKLVAGAGLPIVIGTTGWYDRIDEATRIINERGTGLVYGSNFSIGVNLMFRIAAHSAGLFSRFPSFDPFIEEAHHKFKKDAPSGTAIFLKRIVDGEYERETPTSSTRAGYMPGSHLVGFDSPAETLIITHTARNREGFADGALIAAKWIIGKKGVFEFSEIIDEWLKGV